MNSYNMDLIDEFIQRRQELVSNIKDHKTNMTNFLEGAYMNQEWLSPSTLEENERFINSTHDSIEFCESSIEKLNGEIENLNDRWIKLYAKHL